MNRRALRNKWLWQGGLGSRSFGFWQLLRRGEWVFKT